MSAKTVGFLGGGRVVRILLDGWQRAGRMPVEVSVHDPDRTALAKLQTRFPSVRGTPDIWLLGQMSWVFAAVHPPALVDALRPLAGKLRADAVVVSLAPKVRIARLTEALGGFERIARTIPNAPSLVGAGFNPVAFGPGLPEDDRRILQGVTQTVGGLPRRAGRAARGVRGADRHGADVLLVPVPATPRAGPVVRPAGSGGGHRPGCDGRGAAQTMFASGLSAEEVMDLVPVRPLRDDEETIRAAYRSRLGGIYQKLVG